METGTDQDDEEGKQEGRLREEGSKPPTSRGRGGWDGMGRSG